MLTGQGNPGKHLSVGQLQFLQPYLSAQVHGRLLLWALSETAAKLTSCRAAVPPYSFNLIRRQPTDLTPLPTTHRVEVVLTSGKALQTVLKCPCEPDIDWLVWGSRQELNLQPTDYKTVALPVELQEHVQEICL